MNIEKIIHDIIPSMKICDVTTTINRNTYKLYTNSLKNNKDSVLYFVKCPTTELLFDKNELLIDCKILYMDLMLKVSKTMEISQVKMAITRFLNSEDIPVCNICMESAGKINCVACEMCGHSFCKKCLLETAIINKDVADNYHMCSVCCDFFSFTE